MPPYHYAHVPLPVSVPLSCRGTSCDLQLLARHTLLPMGSRDPSMVLQINDHSEHRYPVFLKNRKTSKYVAAGNNGSYVGSVTTWSSSHFAPNSVSGQRSTPPCPPVTSFSLKEQRMTSSPDASSERFVDFENSSWRLTLFHAMTTRPDSVLVGCGNRVWMSCVILDLSCAAGCHRPSGGLCRVLRFNFSGLQHQSLS
jgi:hypothetical protein